MRMQKGADWREVARIVLHIDPNRDPDRAKRAYERARMTARQQR
jgi:hypothetical protein